MRHSIKIIIGSLIGVLLIVGVVTVGALVALELEMREFFAKEEVRPMPFTKEGWAREGASTDGTRQAMIHDLMSTRKLVGLSEGEILELLGSPNRAAWAPPTVIIYRLGPERGPFGVDSEWLQLYLDDQRVVIATGVETD